MIRRLIVLFMLPLFVFSCLAAGDELVDQPVEELGELVDQPVEEFGELFDQPVEELGELVDQPVEELGELVDQPVEELGELVDQPVDVLPQLVGIETYSLEPITPSDTSGLKAVLLSVLGNYDSIVTEYRYENYNGSYSYIREVQPDYVFLCSSGIFALLLWCVFRMAGGFFCRK